MLLLFSCVSSCIYTSFDLNLTRALKVGEFCSYYLWFFRSALLSSVVGALDNLVSSQ